MKNILRNIVLCLSFMAFSGLVIAQDTDADGVDDQFEVGLDTDSDGTEDYLDTDDDGDGVLTSDENPNPDSDGNPTTGSTQDSDGDGLADYLDTDDDGDGINTIFEIGKDTDGDGTDDNLDSDDDGDGILTRDENPNPDGDGDPSTGATQDSDNDGIPDYLDSDQLSIFEEEFDPIDIVCWPNPSNSGFNINTHGNSYESAIKVYSSSGKVLLNINVQANQQIHFGKALPPGIYFVKVKQRNQNRTLKLVKY